jgi:thioesterase domain-containing protein
LSGRDGAFQEFSGGQIENLVETLTEFSDLTHRYRPARIAADIDLFQANGHIPIESLAEAWRRLTSGSVSVTRVACAHLEMLDPDPASLIARCMREQLRAPRCHAAAPNCASV